MPKFSQRSLTRLHECHPDIVRVMLEAIKEGPDFSVLCGYRGEMDQNEAVARGYSKVKFPDSMHNQHPARAVDIAPHPTDWQDHGRFKHLSVHILMVAQECNIALEWGGHWTRFTDMPHYQLTRIL